MGRLGRLNHVAVAAQDCMKAAGLWRMLGAKVSEPVSLPAHGVKTVFVELDNTKLELLEPLDGDQSPLAGFLRKTPAGGMHHMCVEVDDVQEIAKEVREMGIRTLSDSPKVGAHGLPVIFLHPKDTGGVLIEFEQKPN